MQLFDDFEVEDLGICEEWVYDIEVEDNHNFFANNICVHNSVYICLNPYVKQHIKETDDHAICDELDKFIDDKLQPIIDECYTELAECLNADARMFMKREKIIRYAIWMEKKKRYAMYIIDDEGKVRYKTPKLDYKGLDAARGEFPRICRDWLEECYEYGLKNDRFGLSDFVIRKEAEFHNIDLDIIAKPMGIKNLEKRDPYNGSGKFQTGTPANAKAALAYNWLVDRLGLNYDKIKSGDKIKIVKLVKNQYKLDTIAYKDALPPEFGLLEYVDYHGAFEKNFIKPMNNFLTAIKWDYRNGYDLNSLDSI